MTLLLDITGAPTLACDACLEVLYKSMSEDAPGLGESMLWRPHEVPWLKALVEDATKRFQAILLAIQDTLARLLTGKPIGELKKSDAPWERMDPVAYQATLAALEAKDPAEYTLDDWLAVCDLLIAEYLPDGVIRTEAEYLTVRATLSGMIEANMAKAPHPRQAEAMALLVPTDFAHVPERVLTPLERHVLRIAHARAAENISDVAESARHRMKALVIEHVQAQVLGQKEGQYRALDTRLFDEFGQLNRDFRRIAITEAGDAFNQGFVSAMRPGRKIRRQEAYYGACDWCKSINGKVVTVVAPDARVKNGDTDVWVGKTNIGRSASPRRRVGNALIERSLNERWWIAAGVQHPNCRGSWALEPEAKPNVDPAFIEWMDGLIAASKREQFAKQGWGGEAS